MTNPVRLAAFAAAMTLSSTLMSQTTPTTVPAPTTRDADVPVKRVALFSSGVGYFEHAGTVAGNGDATLRFKTEQVNDVLKSLVLADLDGGKVASVGYQSQDPLDRTLAGFQIDLNGEPALWQILQQLRGAEVAVTIGGNRYVGTILGVEPRKRAVDDKAVVEVATLNLITHLGIQSLAIDDAQSIQFADPKLNEELGKALASVASARDSDKKTVTVQFRGSGDRRVRLGYVVETPIWKTSYRLSIGEDPTKSNLQGWAIVENQTDADWNGVDLSLVSGRPMSFRMELYEPIYLPRPEAKLELFAGLRPQTYAEARENYAILESASAPTASAPMKRAARERGDQQSFGMAAPASPMPATLADDSSVVAQATGGQIGELFQYAISDVTIARQSSAMVPIVSEPVEVAPISIFNSSVLARYPLHGARVKNTTDKHLLQGPITVFNDGGYAGDAQVNNVPPGESRLISFGVDLQTLVDADKTDQTSSIIGVKIVNGMLQATSRTMQSRHYAIVNKGDKKKTIVIEHPKLAGNWSLVETPQPTETTDALYRFDRAIEPGKSEAFTVHQVTINAQMIAMLNANVDQLVYFTRQDATPAKVKDAIAKALSLRQEQVTLEREIAEHQKRLDEVAKEQSRIRDNMKTVERNSAYHGRLMKKLDEQESDIEATQTKIDELTKARDAKRVELQAYLNELNVE